MALSFSDVETGDNNYLDTNISSPQISYSKKSKKTPFHWNSTDECTILENLYEFAGKNGSYSKDFYHYVKGKLSGEVSNSQLSDKVYRLRKRFMKGKCSNMNNNESEGKNRELFSDQEKVFELSSKIWGSDSNNNKAKKGLGSSVNIEQWKPEQVELFNEKRFQVFIENTKLDITFIPIQVLEEIRKQWQHLTNAKNDYHLKNANLLVEIADIRCTQNNSSYVTSFPF